VPSFTSYPVPDGWFTHPQRDVPRTIAATSYNGSEWTQSRPTLHDTILLSSSAVSIIHSPGRITIQLLSGLDGWVPSMLASGANPISVQGHDGATRQDPGGALMVAVEVAGYLLQATARGVALEALLRLLDQITIGNSSTRPR